MRISDWSSDVCSSDLFGDGRDRRGHLLDLADPSRVAGVVPMGAWAPRGRPRKRAGCWSVMMSIKSWVAWPGAPIALASAALFGARPPLAKALAGGGISPCLLGRQSVG